MAGKASDAIARMEADVATSKGDSGDQIVTDSDSTEHFRGSEGIPFPDRKEVTMRPYVPMGNEEFARIEREHARISKKFPGGSGYQAAQVYL